MTDQNQDKMDFEMNTLEWCIEVRNMQYLYIRVYIRMMKNLTLKLNFRLEFRMTQNAPQRQQ